MQILVLLIRAQIARIKWECFLTLVRLWGFIHYSVRQAIDIGFWKYFVYSSIA